MERELGYNLWFHTIFYELVLYTTILGEQYNVNNTR